MKVYSAINAVTADLVKEGITKDRKNVQQGYSFRGIDDVYNALAPLLSRHGLCVLPRILTRQCEERVTQKGGVLFYVTVEAEFDFVAAEDGSKHVVRTFGEAMDSGDKATNKAMSAAYKYAAFQAFAIPTEGDNDADTQTHQPAPKADRGNPLDGVWEALTPEDQAWFMSFGAEVIRINKENGIIAVVDHIEKQEPKFSADDKAALWVALKSESALRTAINKEIRNRKEPAA